jgi:hypothetical protein
MSKVKIYTCTHNRPDFIRLQYEAIKRHVKDDFEFIVFNNERPGGDGGYEESKISEIDSICEEIGVESIRVELVPELKYLNSVKMFEDDSYTNGNNACAYSFTWIWKNYVAKNDCLTVMIDSDMFFIRDINLNEEMGDSNFAYVPSYRYLEQYKGPESPGKLALKYPWNGIVFAKPHELPNPESISWGCGHVDGIAVDVGGEAHTYLEENKEKIKEKYIDQWGLLVDLEAPFEINYSGCGQMIADFQRGEVEIRDYQESNLRTFPHQTERENYWEYVYNNIMTIIKVAEENQFPRPTFVDFIKFETDNNLLQDAFVFHYKNASNTLPWMKGETGLQYNHFKTQALQNLLNKFQFQKRVLGE